MNRQHLSEMNLRVAQRNQGFRPSTITRLALVLLCLVVVPLQAAGASSDPIYFQAGNVALFSNPSVLVPGAATLIRTNEGISYQLYTSGLAPGAATVWIAIFNRPDNCAGGAGNCAPSDLSNPATEGSLVYGSGGIVSTDTIGNFHGSLSAGAPPAGTEVNVPMGTANGLKDPRKADIHLVVRSHGAVSGTGDAVNQLTTFQAVCASCMNAQVVIFPAVK